MVPGSKGLLTKGLLHSDFTLSDTAGLDDIDKT